MSNTVTASFKWLEVLEKEFDNSYVHIDLMLNELVKEAESSDILDDTMSDLIGNLHDKVNIMCSAWAQLVHKSQTIFQTNCKLEVFLALLLTH